MTNRNGTRRIVSSCLLVGSLGAFGCGGTPGVFTCTTTAQCDLHSRGVCESTHFCAYPSMSCSPELQYDPGAGGGLGGTCVPIGEAGVADAAIRSDGVSASDRPMLSDESVRLDASLPEAMRPDAPRPDAPPADAAAVLRKEIYLITVSGSGGFGCGSQNIEVIDAAAGKWARDTSMNGAVALAFRNGLLYVARRSSYQRITVLNPDTLTTAGLGTIPLLGMPRDMVVTKDGHYAYTVDSDSNIRKIDLTTGSTVAQLALPVLASGATNYWVSISLNSTETMAGLAASTAATTPAQATTVDVSGATGKALVLSHSVLCGGPNGTQANRGTFSPDDAYFIVFDGNQTDFWEMRVSDGSYDSADYIAYTRGGGVSTEPAIAKDAYGSFWEVNYQDVYRGNLADKTKIADFSAAPGVAAIVFDGTGKAGWVVRYDSSSNEYFSSLDPLSGTMTMLPWNLVGFVKGSIPSIVYVER